MMAEEVAQKLRAHTAQDPSSVPSTHIVGWFTITVTPAPWGVQCL